MDSDERREQFAKQESTGSTGKNNNADLSNNILFTKTDEMGQKESLVVYSHN